MSLILKHSIVKIILEFDSFSQKMKMKWPENKETPLLSICENIISFSSWNNQFYEFRILISPI